MKNFTVYCDMDGVLTDFDAHFISFYKKPFAEYIEQKGIERAWEAVDRIDHFWLTMPWTPRGRFLWNYIKRYDPILLTTPAETVRTCKQDKRDWAARNLGGGVRIIFSEDKYIYSKKDTILIDDMEKNISLWNTYEGYGILHLSTDNTIRVLEALGI